MTDADRLAREQQRAGVRFVIGPMPIIGRTNFLLDWIAFERGIAAEYQAELAASRQSRAALEQAVEELAAYCQRQEKRPANGTQGQTIFQELKEKLRVLLRGAGKELP